MSRLLVRECLSLSVVAHLNVWCVSPSAVAPCLSIRPPLVVQPLPRCPLPYVSIFPHLRARCRTAKRTMGLCARVAFSCTPSTIATLPTRTPRPVCPHCGPIRPSPPAPRAPEAPPPAASGAQLRDTQSPSPPPCPPRSPSTNKSRFLSPQQIKGQEGVKNSFSSPGGGGAREKLGLWGLFDGECVGNPEECGCWDRRGRARRREEGPPPGPPRPPRSRGRLRSSSPSVSSRSQSPSLSPLAPLLFLPPLCQFSQILISLFFFSLFPFLLFVFASPLSSSTSFSSFSHFYSLQSLAQHLYLDLNSHPLSSLFVSDTLCASLCLCFLMAPSLCLWLWFFSVGS